MATLEFSPAHLLCRSLFFFLCIAGAQARQSEDPAAGREPQAETRPNILLFYVDDLGHRDLSCMGSGFYETPHIDALGAAGMRFSDAYSNAPNCAPSRACLMSGKYSPRHGVYTVHPPTRGKAKDRRLIPASNLPQLEKEHTTIAEVLSAAGYRCAHFGKWHLGEGELGPRARGFELNVGGTRAGHPKRYFPPYGNPELEDGPEGEYLTDRLTTEACSFLESCARQDDPAPFFLYMSHFAVHSPIQAPQPLTDKYRQKRSLQNNAGETQPSVRNSIYAGMIEATDNSLGALVAKLEALGLLANTLILFYSDNGGVGGITSMAPLRGSKGMLYEGGIRVPFIARWDGKIEAGTHSSEMIIGTDLFPTFVELARAEPPEGLDGLSLVPHLTGKQATMPARSLHWHFPAYLQGKKARGARDELFRTRPAGVIRRGSWKLIEYFEDGALELYDLSRDIGEQTNLATSKPDLCKQLHEEMKVWRVGIGAPVPTTPNPEYEG